MKAAIVEEPGALPAYGEFRDPQPEGGKLLIRVSAASLGQLTKLRAAGRHYSGQAEYPFIPGVDGTGVTGDGRRIYFMLPDAPFGAMAEQCVVNAAMTVELPEGLDDDVAAALAIPGMSSWAALLDRARLRSGETVLVNGATGTSGRLAVHIAKYLGAQRVIATGRGTARFGELKKLGADATIELVADRATLNDAFAAEYRRGIDIVLDYLWGTSAEVLLSAATAGPAGRIIRYVQIGSVAGDPISLPSAVLRSSSLELMGSGIGSLSATSVLGAIDSLFKAAAGAAFPISIRRVPLAEVSNVWTQPETGARIVFVPDFTRLSQHFHKRFSPG